MNRLSLSKIFSAVSLSLITVGFCEVALGQNGNVYGAPDPTKAATICADPQNRLNEKETKGQCINRLSGGAGTDNCSSALSSYNDSEEKYSKACSRLGGEGAVTGGVSACMKKAQVCQRAMSEAGTAALDEDFECDDLPFASCPELAGMSLSDLREENSDLRSERDSSNSKFEEIQDAMTDFQKDQMEQMQDMQRGQSAVRQKQQELIQNLEDQYIKLGSDKVNAVQNLRSQYLAIDGELTKLRDEMEKEKATLLKRTNDIYRKCEAQVLAERKAEEQARKTKKNNRGSQTRLGYSKQQRTKEDQATYTKCLRSVESRSAFAEIENDQQSLVRRIADKQALLEKQRAIIVTNLQEQEKLAEANVQRAAQKTQAAIDSMEKQLKEQQQQSAQSFGMMQQKFMNLQSRLSRAQANFDDLDKEYNLNQKQLKCARSSSRGKVAASGDSKNADDVFDLQGFLTKKNNWCGILLENNCSGTPASCKPSAANAAPTTVAPSAGAVK